MAVELHSQDWHAILGVSCDADLRDIKRAFRKRVRECHPDVNNGDRAAEAELKKVIQAYRVLSDDTLKKRQMLIDRAFRSAGVNFDSSFDESGDAREFYELWRPSKLLLPKRILAFTISLTMAFGLTYSLSGHNGGVRYIDPARIPGVSVGMQQAGLGQWYERNWWSIWYYQQRIASDPGIAARKELADYLSAQARTCLREGNAEQAYQLQRIAESIDPVVMR